MVATILTTSVSQPKRVNNWSGVKALTDVRFVLLMAGSCFVASGKHPLFLFILPFANLVHHISPWQSIAHELKLYCFRSFYPLLLYRGVRPQHFYPETPVLLRSRCHERRRCSGPSCTRICIRSHRSLQSPDPCSVFLWLLLRGALAGCRNDFTNDDILCSVWFLLWGIYLAYYPLHRSNIGFG